MTEKINIIETNIDPIILFAKWFEEAKQQESKDPNAMNLATVSKNSIPSSRIVLLKSFDKNGFVFYTNLKSKKGESIIINPNVALNFYWKSLGRQVRIEGTTKSVSDKEADDYFDSRPKSSRISACASEQSAELQTREDLENKYKYLTKKFNDKAVPRPVYWSGIRVQPLLLEFWQDMPHRLHDRVEYKKSSNGWLIRRLYP